MKSYMLGRWESVPSQKLLFIHIGLPHNSSRGKDLKSAKKLILFERHLNKYTRLHESRSTYVCFLPSLKVISPSGDRASFIESISCK